MNREERVEKFRALWDEMRWADETVEIFNEDLPEDEFQARHVESVELGSGRWYMHMLEVVELDKDYYVGVCWDRGLTESQENMHEDDDVYLLDRVEKVVTTVEWNKKGRL